MSGDDLAYQALDHIRDDPKSWRQVTYFCESRACFAGWVLHLNASNYNREVSDKECYDPGAAAAKLLGWSWDDAKTVFGSMTTEFSELERLVKNVLNGEVQDSDRLDLNWN